jgi:uncharacterized protein (DUF1778 family)
MPNAATRKDRMNFRLDSQSKTLIERAATTAGQSVTEFAVIHLVKEARSVLREQETTMLSDRDRRAFMSMLEIDAGPNADLKKAASIYRKQRA